MLHCVYNEYGTQGRTSTEWKVGDAEVCQRAVIVVLNVDRGGQDNVDAHEASVSATTRQRRWLCRRKYETIQRPRGIDRSTSPALMFATCTSVLESSRKRTKQSLPHDLHPCSDGKSKDPHNMRQHGISCAAKGFGRMGQWQRLFNLSISVSVSGTERRQWRYLRRGHCQTFLARGRVCHPWCAQRSVVGRNGRMLGRQYRNHFPAHVLSFPISSTTPSRRSMWSSTI